MKKILTLLLVISTLSVYSQQIKHGIHGGVNLSSMNYQHTEMNTNYNMKFNTFGYFGYVLEYSIPIMNHKLQLELNINNNKSKYIKQLGFTTPIHNYYFTRMRRDIDLKQLVVPLIFKFNSSKGVFINLGTYLGANLDVSSDTQIEYFNHLSHKIKKNIRKDLTDQFDFLDFGLIIGVEYNHKSGVFFEFRFNSGMKSITNITDYNINKSIMFGLGYRI